MTRRRLLLFLLLPLLLVSLSSAAWYWATSSAADSAHEARMDQAIDLASDYLVRKCQKSGRFVYRVNLDPTARPASNCYNMLRHAGSVYALAMSQRREPTDEKRKALVRAVGFLRRETLAPVPGQTDMLAIWSRPEIIGKPLPLQAKLGGAGLGLVAMLSVEELVPGTVPLDELQQLGRFIVFMQEPDGSFFAKYNAARGYRTDWAVSLYYPGEAALGLLLLYERDPQPVWLAAAAKTLGYLAAIRADQAEVEADHWALLATARLLPLLDQLEDPPVSRDVVLHHAAQICQSMLDARTDYPANALEHGCFTDDGRTCPTATRVEGLVAALDYLPKEEHAELRARMDSAVDAAVDFLLRAQVRDGRHIGGLASTIRPLPKDHPRYRESRRLNMTEIRIDYVQHTLSGWIQYEARAQQNTLR